SQLPPGTRSGGYEHRRADQIRDPISIRRRRRQRWAPGSIDRPVALGVGVDDPAEHLTDDSSSDLAEAIPILLNVGLAKHVVPERRLGIPTMLSQTDLV